MCFCNENGPTTMGEKPQKSCEKVGEKVCEKVGEQVGEKVGEKVCGKVGEKCCEKHVKNSAPNMQNNLVKKSVKK